MPKIATPDGDTLRRFCRWAAFGGAVAAATIFAVTRMGPAPARANAAAPAITLYLGSLSSAQVRSWEYETAQIAAQQPEVDGLEDVGSRTVFAEALQLQYLVLAEAAINRDDIDLSNFYAMRAELIGAGKLPEPLKPLGDAPAEADQARATLLAAFEREARERAPSEAARAQAVFDCWSAHIGRESGASERERCRAEVRPALEALEAAAPEPAEEPAAAEDGGETRIVVTREDAAPAAQEDDPSAGGDETRFRSSATREGFEIVVRSGDADAEVPAEISAAAPDEPVSSDVAEPAAEEPPAPRAPGVVVAQPPAPEAEAASSVDAPSQAPSIIPIAVEREPRAGGAGAQRLVSNQTEGVTTVYFAFDSARLSGEAKRALRAAARQLRREGSALTIELAGHADRAGSEAHNLRLSERRAEAVFGYLAGRLPGGVAYDIAAYGETQPAKPTADGVREPLNRRVEIAAR